MRAVLRHFATLLALVALGATSVAGLEARPGADAHDGASTPATQGCAQSTAVAANAGTGGPHCPSAPMASTGLCGGPVALPSESRIQFDGAATAEPLSAGPREARDLLHVTPFFRPPIV